MFKCSWCYKNELTKDNLLTEVAGGQKIFIHQECYAKWKFRGREISPPTVERRKSKRTSKR